MIVILDYGMGNTGSILNMLRKIGCDATVSADIKDIEAASGIILPGVGSFDNGMEKLNALGIVDILKNKVVVQKTPFLGVCLGMQLLLTRSEEGDSAGLDWISGVAKRFNFKSQPESAESKRLKIPHMGWNLIHPSDQLEPLFFELQNEARFYFVHSYAVQCDHKENVLARTKYGYDFACAIRKENIYGVQFHPEKSHKFGMKLFRNFMELVNVKS